jgi:hypothetical protein
MGQSHGTRTAFDASTASYGFGFRYIQGNGNGPAAGGGGQFYSWYQGLGAEYPATGAGSYGMYIAIPRNPTTPYMSVRYNEGNGLGAWSKIAAGYADTSGTAGNITSYTINQSVGTGNNVTFNLVDATQFRDSNNTGFYLDPASSSYLNTVSLGAQTWRADITWNAAVNIFVNGESSFDMGSGGTFHVWDSGDGNFAIRANYGGQTVIGQAGSRGLSVIGAITATGNITAYSDSRIKRDIYIIENALEKTLALRGVTYFRTDDRIKEEDKQKRKVGVVAQEVERILPEVVCEDADGFKSVDYGNITALLIEAIKEQQTTIESLKDRILVLENIKN